MLWRVGNEVETRQGSERLTAIIMLEKLPILAPIALILPWFGGKEFLPLADDQTYFGEREETYADVEKVSGKVHALPARYSVPLQFQVRIEQRVIVRISPRATSARQNLLAELPQTQPTRFVERKIGDCIELKNIAAVQTGSGNRLVLFTRDQMIISAKLEKACRARDFYSGFYVEQNEDGKLCVKRDKLQSRAGANCEIRRIRQLVPENG